MFDFLNLEPEAFGIDISDSSIKVANVKKSRKGFKLVSFGETELKQGIMRQGEIRNEKALVEAIKKAVNSAQGRKITSKYVVASLSEEKAFLQIIQMPKLLEQDLKSAVIYEAENYIPLPIQDVYLDSQIVSSSDDHQDILITALPKKIIDPQLDALKKAGLKPLALEIESMAVVRASIKNELSPEPILLIDFGAARTNFMVFSGNSLRFTSSIPVSSRSFTESISQSLNVDMGKAEKLKVKYGLETMATREGGMVFDALIPPLTDLIEQIKKHIDFYQSHATHEHSVNAKSIIKIKKIILCGGGTYLKGLADFLETELKVKVEKADLWTNVLNSVGSGPVLDEKSLKYVTAVGLALRAALKSDNA